MSTEKIATKLKLFEAGFIDIGLLFIGFALAQNIQRFVKFGHPLKYGVLNTSSFSPEINFPVIIGMVIATILFYWLLKKLRAYNKSAFRAVLILTLVFSFVIGVVGPRITSYHNNIDSFHHGEQLAPAVAFSQGKLPYKDLFILHGAGEDILMPWVSFKLFGESIGSYFLLVGLLEVATFILFMLLVWKLFKSDAAFLFVTLWFVISSYLSFYFIRDLTVWLSLIIVYSLIKSRFKNSQYKLALLGFIASMTLFYAFDRGTFLTALVALVGLLLILFSIKSDAYVFDIRGVIKRVTRVIPLILGFLAGAITVFVALGPGGFYAFIKMTAQLTKYQGAIFNRPYPDLLANMTVEWLPVIILIVLGVVLGRTFWLERNKITPQTMFELVLFLFSIVFFRAATGRPDIGHVTYASVPLLLLFFVVLFNRIEQTSSATINLRPLLIYRSAPVFFALFILLLPTYTHYLNLAIMNETPLIDAKIFLKASQKNDTYWTTDRIEKISSDLVKAAKDDKKLFVFSSEPLFYYTTRMQNPTRYAISWFADAQPLESDMLKSLTINPPSVILYKSGVDFNDSPDGVPMSIRLPQVNKWIMDNYSVKSTDNNAVILVKN